jgi:MFS transporter, DHA2 family, multidrug resistance protein
VSNPVKVSSAGRWAVLAIVSSAVFLIVIDIRSVHQAFGSAYFTALAIAASLLFVLAIVGLAIRRQRRGEDVSSALSS